MRQFVPPLAHRAWPTDRRTIVGTGRRASRDPEGLDTLSAVATTDAPMNKASAWPIAISPATTIGGWSRSIADINPVSDQVSKQET